MDIERENRVVIRKDVNEESMNGGKWWTSEKSFSDWSRFMSLSGDWDLYGLLFYGGTRKVEEVWWPLDVEGQNRWSNSPF